MDTDITSPNCSF